MGLARNLAGGLEQGWRLDPAPCLVQAAGLAPNPGPAFRAMLVACRKPAGVEPRALLRTPDPGLGQHLLVGPRLLRGGHRLGNTFATGSRSICSAAAWQEDTHVITLTRSRVAAWFCFRRTAGAPWISKVFKAFDPDSLK